MDYNKAVIAHLQKEANYSILYLIPVLLLAALIIFHGPKWQYFEFFWFLLLIPVIPRFLRACLLFWSLTRFIFILENVQPIKTEIQTQYSWWWDDLVIKFKLRELELRAVIVKSWSKDPSRKGMVDVVEGAAGIYIDPNGSHGAVIETDNGFLFVHCLF